MRVTDSDLTELKRNKYYGDSSQEKRFVNSMVFRFFVLLILLALLSIPVKMMENAFDEQINQHQSVADELSKQWGNEQTIIGPILSIPYVERISKIESQTDSNGVKSSVSKDIFNNKTLILLPENLRINANLKDKLLSKDSNKVHVYKGEIEISGNFDLEDLPDPSAYISIDWDKAFVALGVNNNKSVQVSSPLRWEDNSATFQPGTKLSDLIKQGFHASLEDVANDAELPQFKIQLTLKGKHNFKFAPLGELTSTSIISDSSQVKIQGDIAASSTVRSDENFEGIWRITNLVRNYPQQWLIEENSLPVKPDFLSVLTGVEILANPKESNQKLATIKSIIPFLISILGIIFLSVLILEFKRNTHAKPKFLHYLVIALSVLSIPIILLTIKDLTNFEQAYQIVAGTSIILIVIYIMSVLKSFFKAFYILLILASLYATLYIKLQMPEYALFALSAAGLFITVLLMMASINLHEDE